MSGCILKRVGEYACVIPEYGATWLILRLYFNINGHGQKKIQGVFILFYFLQIKDEKKQTKTK